MCFFNSAEKSYLELHEPQSTLKVIICRRYSFQKLTQLSQEYIVINAAAFYIDGFL
jgi:hypothetical protein